MEYLGLFFEILFLALGIYLYLFARGLLKVKDPALNARAEAFRRENSGWMRILGLLLAAVMLINLVMRVVG